MGETGEKNDLPTIADDLVVTKYKMSADIVNSKPFLISLPICKCRHYEFMMKLEQLRYFYFSGLYAFELV